MLHFADRLAELIRFRGHPLCVGIDPRWESLPQNIQAQYFDDSLLGFAAGFEAFGKKVLELVVDHVSIVKFQSAFFEACGPDGMKSLQNLLRLAREMNFLTILDGKRNDIASTATAYAEASLGGSTFGSKRFPIWNADALTVNPYLGRDALEPFIQAARRDSRGLFILVRTSNPGAGLFQNLESQNRPLYEYVSDAVSQWNQESLGDCGFGDLGAVVGATYPSEIERLRSLAPNTWFLVPGFGAQGGKPKDIALAMRQDGLGAIVNSSRGITFPFKPDDLNWEKAIQTATLETIASLQAVMP